MGTAATNASGANASNSSPGHALSTQEAIVWGALCTTEGFLIVVGNSLAAATFSRTRQLRKRSMFLVMNLVAADLLVGALAIPSWIYVSFGWAFQCGTCHSALFRVLVFPIIDMLSSFASIGCMVALSVERLHATFRPLRHRLVTSGSYIACIVALWALALFPIPLRLEIYYGRMEVTSLIAWVPIQLALLLLISVAYLAIWIKIRFGSNHPSGQHFHVRDRKLTMVLIVVAVVSLFAWLPFIILNIIYMVDPTLFYPRALYSIKLLHYGNSLVNPMIYPYRMPVFRRALTRLICGASRRVHPRHAADLMHKSPHVASTAPEDSKTT